MASTQKDQHKEQLLTTVDISKAFGAIPQHRLTDKLNNTNMHNNTKRWLANYLGGRQSHVSFNSKSSHTRNFNNGVPQGSVLSPTLINIYMYDTPRTPANINIISYADDFIITSTHNDIPTVTAQLQSYLNTLTLDNIAIAHKHSSKILGVTYDTSLSFKGHIHDIKKNAHTDSTRSAH